MAGQKLQQEITSRACRTWVRIITKSSPGLVQIRARCASRAGRRRLGCSRIIARRAVVTRGRREALLGAILSVRARCTTSTLWNMLATACRTHIALLLIGVVLVSNWTIKAAGRTFVACKLPLPASFAMGFCSFVCIFSVFSLTARGTMHGSI